MIIIITCPSPSPSPWTSSCSTTWIGPSNLVTHLDARISPNRFHQLIKAKLGLSPSLAVTAAPSRCLRPSRMVPSAPKWAPYVLSMTLPSSFAILLLVMTKHGNHLQTKWCKKAKWRSWLWHEVCYPSSNYHSPSETLDVSTITPFNSLGTFCWGETPPPTPPLLWQNHPNYMAH